MRRLGSAAVATVVGMMGVTWLTMTGLDRLRLEALERFVRRILRGPLPSMTCHNQRLRPV